MNATQIREQLRHFDKVTVKKDGTVEVRDIFFYRHGRSVESTVERVKQVFPNAVILAAFEKWQTWPRESYWLVRFAPGI